MRKGKKMIILFASVFVLAVMMSFSTEAAGKKVARIGKKNYSSVSEAIKKVKKNQTIVLLKNSKENMITCDRNVKFKLNLNKHTLKSDIIVQKGDMTIYNGTLRSTDTHCGSLISVSKKAKVTVNGGNYYGSFSCVDKAVLTINKGTFRTIVSKYNEIVDNIGNSGTTIIKNGTFIATGKNNCNINNAGKLVIYKGKFTSDREILDTSKEGSKVDIKGGTFFSKGKAFGEKNPNIRMFCSQDGTMTIANAKVTADGCAYPVYIYGPGRVSVKNSTFGLGNNVNNVDESEKMFIVMGRLTMDGCKVDAKGKIAVSVSHSGYPGYGEAYFSMSNSTITGSHAWENDSPFVQSRMIYVSLGKVELKSGTIKCSDPEREILKVDEDHGTCIIGKGFKFE